MHWQDEEPINDLIREGSRISDSYLTIARIGDDRKEAQIGSQPIATVQRAREWLDRQAAAAAVATGHARFRIRLWRPNKTAVRSVQTRMWLKPDAITAPAPLGFVPDAAGLPTVGTHPAPSVEQDSGPDPYYNLDAPSLIVMSPGALAPRPVLENALPHTPAADRAQAPLGPGSRLAPLAATRSEPTGPSAAAPNRPAGGGGPRQHVQGQTGAPSERPVQRQAPQPAYEPAYAPCPTCASAATTIATQDARLAELSGQIASVQQSLRDKEAAVTRATQIADQRRSRVAEMEAEGNRAARLILSLRKELAEAHETAEQMSALIDSLDT